MNDAIPIPVPNKAAPPSSGNTGAKIVPTDMLPATPQIAPAVVSASFIFVLFASYSVL